MATRDLAVVITTFCVFFKVGSNLSVSFDRQMPPELMDLTDVLADPVPDFQPKYVSIVAPSFVTTQL